MRELIDNIFDVKAVWNPFTQVVVLTYCADLSLTKYQKEFTYEETDEWNSFEQKVENGKIKVYDIHIHYDEEPFICIYEVINNQTVTEKQIEVELKIKY